jgi:cytochrome b involved in lipid metabolism
MSASTKSFIAVIAIVLIGAGAFFLSREKDATTVNSSPSATTQTTQQTNNNTTSEVQPAQPSSDSGDVAGSDLAGPITLEQVALHSSEDDCWTIINGSVYDITNYIPRHPGGDDILLACGTDGTSLFAQRTTADGEEIGSGSPHSNNAKSQLNSLKLGELSR